MPQSSRKRLVKKSSKASLAAPPEEQPWATAHLRKGNQSMAANESTVAESDNTNKLPEQGEQAQDTTSTTITTTMAAAAAVATTAEEDTDAINPLPPRNIYIDPLSGHSNVTIPAHPPRRHAFSECFDLDDLEPGGHIRSPSGNILSAEQAATRADRPMGIKERQEAIRRKVAEQSQLRMGNETTVVGDAKAKAKAGKAKEEKKKTKKMGRLKAWLVCRCL